MGDELGWTNPLILTRTSKYSIIGNLRSPTPMPRFPFPGKALLRKYPPWNKQFVPENGWLEDNHFVLGAIWAYFQRLWLAVRFQGVKNSHLRPNQKKNLCVPNVVKGLGTLEVGFLEPLSTEVGSDFRWTENGVKLGCFFPHKKPLFVFFLSRKGSLQVHQFPAQKGFVWEGFFCVPKTKQQKSWKGLRAKANGWIEKRGLPPLQIFCCDEHFWVHPRNLTYIMTPKWWFGKCYPVSNMPMVGYLCQISGMLSKNIWSHRGEIFKINNQNVAKAQNLWLKRLLSTNGYLLVWGAVVWDSRGTPK